MTPQYVWKTSVSIWSSWRLYLLTWSLHRPYNLRNNYFNWDCWLSCSINLFDKSLPCFRNWSYIEEFLPIESTFCFRLTVVFALSKITRTDCKHTCTSYFIRLVFITDKDMQPLDWTHINTIIIICQSFLFKHDVWINKAIELDKY